MLKSLLILIFPILSISLSLSDKSELINAIADFCTSHDGYDSGFCVDYAKLRRGQ